jgi:hypothetical protein
MRMRIRDMEIVLIRDGKNSDPGQASRIRNTEYVHFWEFLADRLNRYYNPKIGMTMTKNVVAKMDMSVDRELARLAKSRKKKEARNLLLDFYKKSLFFNKNFKEDVALGAVSFKFFVF